MNSTSKSNASESANTGFNEDDAKKLVEGQHENPFAVLGVHPSGDGWIVRTFLPGADTVQLSAKDGTVCELIAYGDQGLFWQQLADRPGRYELRAGNSVSQWQVCDPYQFGPVLGEVDEYLLSEGTHQKIWQVLGAHLVEHEGQAGAVFAVWAPNARRVSVVGDFNQWDGRRYPMRRRGTSGVWEIFIPNMQPGSRYKYEILQSQGGMPVTKADPVGRQMEMRPGTCSVLAPELDDQWQDKAWMQDRGDRQNVSKPISVYEVHMGSWRRTQDGRWLTYPELAESLIPYVLEMGFTHIEMLPITEHPYDGSWGYQPVGMYAPTSRFGSAQEFAQFVQACHQAGIGVILDWVPAHFPIDAHGLENFDGSKLYEHMNPQEGYHPDWNTLIYNLGRREVVNYLQGNALYWLEEFHIDALRVDAVASMLYRDYSRKEGEWIPNKYGGRENLESIDFLQHMNTVSYANNPGIMTIAEESTAWPGVSRPVDAGGLGFGFKWNMGWMHDTLEFMQQDPLYRRYHHGKMSFGLEYAFSENYILPLSHDEVVHGKGSLWQKMPGDGDTKLANLRAYYAYMWAHPGKKLLFMGQEFGQHSEWSEQRQLEWERLNEHGHAGLRQLVCDLNHLYRDLPALHQMDCVAEGFEWIDGAAADAGVFAWLRKGAQDAAPVLAVFNFSGTAHHGWRLGVPNAGRWKPVLSTDAQVYGGWDAASPRVLESEPQPYQGRPQSVQLDMAALSGTWYVWEGK